MCQICNIALVQGHHFFQNLCMHPPIQWAKSVSAKALYPLLHTAMDGSMVESLYLRKCSWVDDPNWRKLACFIWVDFRNIGLSNASLGRSWRRPTKWDDVRYTYFCELSNTSKKHVLHMESTLQHMTGLHNVGSLYYSIMSTYCSEVWCQAWDILMQEREIPNIHSIQRCVSYSLRDTLKNLD